MQINDTNQGDLLLSRNISDIRIDCPGSSRLNVRFYYGATVWIPSQLIPIDGVLDIPLRDILNSIKPLPDWRSPIGASVRIALPSFAVDITDPDTEERVIWQKTILHGGIDMQDPQDILAHRWLTWRPQESVTHPASIELLHCVKHPEYNGSKTGSLNVFIDVYTELSGRHTVWYASAIDMVQPYIVQVNASYAQIIKNEEIADLVADKIVAYDIYADTEIINSDNSISRVKEVISRQRFIVRPTPDNHIDFLFRNTFGVFEGITARGSETRILQAEISSFISNLQENILSNDAVCTREVNTGYITSERSLALWEDFLSSTEHYVIRKDGGIEKIIIDNPDTKFTLKQLDSLTFSFHMASQPKGRFYEYQDLEYFDYDQAAEL